MPTTASTSPVKHSSSYSWSRLGRTEAERRKSKEFPPPISSLSQDGKPAFFLRPVRQDGRLKLRQVRSNRPETLLASRKDGRLRMHLIYSDDDQNSREYSEQEESEDESQDAITEEEEEEEEERVMECKFPVTPQGGSPYVFTRSIMKVAEEVLSLEYVFDVDCGLFGLGI
ncbi:PREDICTED: protein FANTASTIC FOUR 1 [Ipomoea nil]|uniref:protein FANTASTIC FOUR 1 n=1 Tax=Ipomoea nil TaxID=35883 RepID=UPI000901FE03|nr:PREDICTED: protein FANTASTIC FOUR 1 [Ipomoea nil]